MKIWHWILTILVIVAVGLAVFFYWTHSPPTTNPVSYNDFPVGTSNPAPTTPDAFTKAFYVWYAGSFEQDPQFPTDHSLPTVLGSWLTPQFIANWNQIVTETDADPVLLSQDNPSGWGNAISASIINQTDSASTVNLTIGSGTSAHVFLVQLVKESDDSWRIDSISKGS